MFRVSIPQVWKFLGIVRVFRLVSRKNRTILSPAEVCDLLKAVILVCCLMVLWVVDTNMLYHLIKSQSVIKLYIFYNMLDVGDKLLISLGQDTLDALLWTATEPKGRKREHLGLVPHLFLAIIYVGILFNNHHNHLIHLGNNTVKKMFLKTNFSYAQYSNTIPSYHLKCGRKC